MERSVQVEGVRYPWREYLLHEVRRGFRWLTETNGHWSFVDPVHAGDVTASGASMEYEGESFKHFQSGFAVVDHVVGEFYWAVSRGDTTETNDYVSPPRFLSQEQSESEARTASARTCLRRGVARVQAARAAADARGSGAEPALAAR